MIVCEVLKFLFHRFLALNFFNDDALMFDLGPPVVKFLIKQLLLNNASTYFVKSITPFVPQ